MYNFYLAITTVTRLTCIRMVRWRWETLRESAGRFCPRHQPGARSNKQGDYRWSAELLKQVIAANLVTRSRRICKRITLNSWAISRVRHMARFLPDRRERAARRVHKFSHGTTGSPDTIRGMSVKCCSTLCPFASIARKPRVKNQPELQYEQRR